MIFYAHGNFHSARGGQLAPDNCPALGHEDQQQHKGHLRQRKRDLGQRFQARQAYAIL